MQFNAIAIFFLLSTIARLVFAIPVPDQSVHRPNKLIVYNPSIKPDSIGSTWVAWETSDLPEEEKNGTATLLLGRLENGSENLDVYYPLATNVPLSDGQVTIKVPKHCEPKSNYIIALLGDSGNISNMFSII
uniref:Yeast cell wall synthesis Kre9/Knh1-like N-terminal domain-containing protein n=1 Tax=Moniliophthora roreri TaxID=221103 RepID=A0A0W0FUE6_MONRR